MWADVRGIKLFLNKISGPSEHSCWLWLGAKNKNGYGVFSSKLAHRLSWSFFNGTIPTNLCVLHKCDVRNCVNPDHLFLGTQQENISDMISKGRQKFLTHTCGVKHWNSLLTKEEVKEIRTERSNGARILWLAKKFNVSSATISRITRMESYLDV